MRDKKMDTLIDIEHFQRLYSYEKQQSNKFLV